eukprot:Skav203364  [mRNA]  locus=scaffold2649:35385:38850:+ [translate_table: standard]
MMIAGVASGGDAKRERSDDDDTVPELPEVAPVTTTLLAEQLVCPERLAVVKGDLQTLEAMI